MRKLNLRLLLGTIGCLLTSTSVQAAVVPTSWTALSPIKLSPQETIPQKQDNSALFAVDMNAKFPSREELRSKFVKNTWYDYGYDYSWNIGTTFRSDFAEKITNYGRSDKRLKREGEDMLYAAIMQLPKEYYPYIGPYLHQVPNMSDKILQLPGIKETKNKFPERISEELKDIPNIEFLSPYLYILLIPEIWPSYKDPTEYPIEKITYPKQTYDAGQMQRLKKIVPPENYYPSRHPNQENLEDKLRMLDATQTSPITSADVKAFARTLGEVKDFAKTIEQKAELTEARWLINQYEASQNQALPINTLKDMVNPCQRLVQRLKLIGRHFEFAKIVAKEGFSLEEWAYTCDKTIKAYRVSKMTASTLQAVMDLQDNVYKSELQKLPDIFKGTQVITMLAIPEMYKAPYKDVQAVKKNRRELEKLFKELDYTLVDAPIEIMP